MDVLYFFLLLIGAVCFAVAATERLSARTGNGERNGVQSLAFLPLGLLFWISVALIESGRVVFD